MDSKSRMLLYSGRSSGVLYSPSKTWWVSPDGMGLGPFGSQGMIGCSVPSGKTSAQAAALRHRLEEYLAQAIGPEDARLRYEWLIKEGWVEIIIEPSERFIVINGETASIIRHGPEIGLICSSAYSDIENPDDPDTPVEFTKRLILKDSLLGHFLKTSDIPLEDISLLDIIGFYLGSPEFFSVSTENGPKATWRPKIHE